MDKFFRAIGRFFKSIIDWIKTTAWVQPLLIVVTVFAIIFSFSASSPLMKWIKSLANSDTAGEFYDKHDVNFYDLYADIFVKGNSGYEYECTVGKRPDGSSAGKILTNNASKYDGYSYVLFIQSNSQESDFKTFYNELTSKEKAHFYVVDFRTDNNKESYYNVTTKEWEDNNCATYYYYLLNHLYDFYMSEEYDAYNDAFKASKGYDINARVWELSGNTEVTNASSELSFPLICKYSGTTLVDFRFLNQVSTDYDGKDTAQVLADFKTFTYNA